ncbi:lig_chan-Glu_bd domain-containing protein [Nephila pilipes]|uniref:Lig_chan-Glu_bd domain-containing protein n=1 Tax=Nephila pilipes TaxID=299642 RepID=A0A8X6K3W1_NEPPI|nr:lig_chan-Glu_bd domain-containing protein [Nephila pilipes]
MQFPRYLKAAIIPSRTCKVEKTGNETVATGIDIQLLNLLAENLNFRYTLHLPEDGGGYGLNKNGTWTGIVGMIARGEADLSTAYLSMSEERSHVVDFSTSYYILETTFATDIPKPLIKYEVLLLPFQMHIWIALLVSFFLVPNVLQQLMFRKQTTLEFFINLLNHKKMPRTVMDSMEHRILMGSWLVFETFVRFIYTSLILSFLTIKPIPRGIKTIPDLSEAIEKGRFKFYVPRGSALVDFLTNSNSEDYQKIGLAIRMNNWTQAPSFMGEMIGDSTVISRARSDFHITYGMPPFSTVSIADDSFQIWNVGIMLRKGFCCKERLNTLVLRICNGGLYQKMIQDEAYRQRFKLSFKTSADEGVKKIGFDELFGIFFVLAILHILSVLIFIMERVYNRRIKKALQ